jgi:hypothetical protein
LRALSGSRERLTKVSIAQAPIVFTPSLREIAAREWQQVQAEAVERKRLELERHRENLISDARNGLYRSFGPPGNDPWRQIDWAKACEFRVGSTDDLLASRPDCCVVVITFMGERFEWKRTGGARNDWGLIHIFDCRSCDLYGESAPLNSLADLGYWLEDAAKRCSHGEDS